MYLNKNSFWCLYDSKTSEALQVFMTEKETLQEILRLYGCINTPLVFFTYYEPYSAFFSNWKQIKGSELIDWVSTARLEVL